MATLQRKAEGTGTRRPTMKAVLRDAYGSADVLRIDDVPRPSIGAGEVLVRVRAAGLDRGAWHEMLGKPYLMRIAGFGLRRPKNAGLGTNLAGSVEAVGAGVTGWAVGDRVFGSGRNAFAEYSVSRPDQLVAMPANATFEQAAAVPVSAVTALQALRDQGRVQAGQKVLVIGASGGVGTFAVQLAKGFGAHVTGVCSTAKIEFVRSVGADDVIDHSTDQLDSAAGFDLVLDIGGNRPLRVLRRLLTPTGTLVFVGGEDGDGFSGGLGRQLRSMAWSPFVGQRLGGMWIARVNTTDLDLLRTMIEGGSLAPAIDRVYPLGQLPDAMRDLEAGKVRGKYVVVPGGV